MMASELEQAIQHYETALDQLSTAASESETLPHQVLEVLIARDRIQAILETFNTPDNTTSPSSGHLAQLSQLD
jgi:hypothetical protein